MSKQNLTARPIRAELIGSNICVADEIRACGCAPVLLLCRKLVAAGYDPVTPLEAWRDKTLALRVRSIGEAADLVINSKGTRLVRRPAVRMGSPMRKTSALEAEEPTQAEAPVAIPASTS